jgi:hypothetical protein
MYLLASPMDASKPAASALQTCWIDLAQEDGIDATALPQLWAAGPPWTGVGLQCSNNLDAYTDWFGAMWPAAGPGAGNPQYGRATFRFTYHYYVCAAHVADPTANEVTQVAFGTRQADVAINAVLAAGGWGDGDLPVAVDIENGEQPAGFTAWDVMVGLTAFAARVRARTGKPPILYGGSLLRQLQITSRMGCDYLWIPEWPPTLDWSLVTEMGWDEASTLLWQAVGDGSDTAPAGYPHSTPIGAALDISIMVDNMSYDQQIAWLQANAGGMLDVA